MKEKDFNKNFQIKKIRLPMFFAKLFNIVNLLLNFFDMKIVRNSRNKILLENEEYAINFKLLKIFSLKNRIKTLKYFSYSQSQLRQDLLVLNTLNFKKRGFFCEMTSHDVTIIDRFCTHSRVFCILSLLARRFCSACCSALWHPWCTRVHAR